ncbi:glycosyltransferase family 2 protein [Streptomyces sp. DSM 40750]|uniref:glycosyltransferase family 2 protein n=1 Tax=Streptomyces sp. DSM 40750 TaxID=2801030 RepID=UPI00214B1D48|nr:glycosyltransferase [Streptomyces sp. DSM 40750]UUU24621.1 glycosyltransferase [Streptomyces sp. DSM 40750]
MTAIKPAPSAPIAVAARAHGDDFPHRAGQARIRLAGLLMLATLLFYSPWMLMSLNERYPWLAWPFAVANVFSIMYTVLVVSNAWSRSVPVRRRVGQGDEPHVGVIVTTCGEPVPMILRSVISVLEQDWPADRMAVVVSDDGHDPELAAAVAELPVVYHAPPPRFAPGRDGVAKAGNLNSALALLDRQHPDLAYIETRDADDEVGSHAFLRETVGQLLADDHLAFVQTIKEAQVSAGDPFNNRETMFFRGQMLARNAANAVFPCGSGLVWRRSALREIGDFPTWNLVEDVQSGVEALRRGWRGLYLPIVGAVGQHCPEDIPSFYKQRGTWAIDTVRLMVWGGKQGLGLRQRLHFTEMLLFYLNAFTLLVYVPSVAFSLLGWTPLDASDAAYAEHLLPLVVITEIWLLTLNHPFNDRRRRQRRPVAALWRQRIMVAGLAPIYMKAAAQAVLSGPNRKPVYQVTRKMTDPRRWHWLLTLPQTGVVVLTVAFAIYAVSAGTLPGFWPMAATLYWAGLNIFLLSGFVTRGWYGVQRSRRGASSTP